MDAGYDGLNDRSRFDVWTRIDVRYRDLDLMGHVNHAVIVSYFEQARNAILGDLPLAPDAGMVLGELQIRYLAEIGRDDSVDIGTGVARIGGKSFTLGQGAFVENGCVAICLGTLVYISRDSRRAASLPSAFRDRLSASLIE